MFRPLRNLGLVVTLVVTLGFTSPAQADTTIFIHNLTTRVTTETPAGFVWEDSPQTDGDLTVLSRHVGSDREIFVRNAILKTYDQITDNDLEDRYPRISGNNIAWVCGEGQASEIYLASYENEEWKTVNVSDISYEDSFPQIKGNYLVWQGKVDGDWEIFLYDIGTKESVQITVNNYDDISPQTDGKYVVWLGYSHTGGEIFLYDILTGKTTQITNDDNVDSPPQIANGLIVWTSCEVTDSVEPGEIFLYDVVAKTKTRLSASVDPDGSLDDSSPRINGERVMWVQNDYYTKPPENFVANPGFEDGDSWPSGWWTWSEELRTYFSSDNETFHSGSKSLKVTIEDSKTYDVLVAQTVPVTPGESYNIGAWIKTENVDGTGAQIIIEWSGPSGWLGGEWNAETVTGTQSWQYTGVERVKIPEEATSVTVYVRMLEGSTGTAWFDDVIVEKQVKPLLSTFVLRPNYAGKILPGAPSPEIKVEITLNPEEYGLTLGEVGITATLRDKNEDIVVQETLNGLSSNSFNVYLDIPTGSQPGEYDLNIDLYKTGDVLAQDTYPIENLTQEDISDLTSYIDDHNRFILNGEPFFPLGLYVAQDDTSQLEEIADSPFDTLMNYSINNVADIKAYLNELEEKDLKLIFSLKDYIGHGQEDIDAITEKVNTFKTYPAIISWYMNDELGLEYLPELEDRYQKVRELDENHPVWSVNNRKYVLMGEAHTTDILGVDPYPVPNNQITMVSEWADWAKEAGRGYRPLWLVPQIFGWSDYDGCEGEPPTRDEMRAMTYLAVNHDAKGLIYYSYFNIRDDDDCETRWEEIKGIASEIDFLRPVILSTHQTNDNDIACNNPNIDFKLMRKDNAYYLLAVNTNTEEETGVSFDINLAKKPLMMSVLFEDGGQVPVIDANFTDNFGPYEVHVYEADSDGDGVPDSNDAFPDNPNEWLDADEDGIGNNADTDDDNDGMPDGWEVLYGLDPFTDDADNDPDGDGVSNLVEYNDGRDPHNAEPSTPNLYLPWDSQAHISLTPELRTTEDFDDQDGDTHAETEWQTSRAEGDFSESALVLAVKSDLHLTSLTVPEFILSVNTTYYWRVRFYDDRDGRSEWSDVFSFTTITSDDTDSDGNGIPDVQKVDSTVDLDDNEILDINQSDIKCVNTVVGGGQIGVKKGSANVTSIESIKSIDPDTISGTSNKPDEMPYGLISFKLKLDNAGDTAEVTIYFSEAAPSGAKWYKYDSIHGWREHPHAIFSPDGTYVVLQLKDGDWKYGDADGIANGTIVDPGGAGSSSQSGDSSGGGSSGGGGCFIATAAFGSPMEKHVTILRSFKDTYLLPCALGRIFVRTYNKYSPPLAHFIAKHEILKVAVRIGLLPPVAVCYATLHFGPVITLSMLVVLLILAIFLVSFYRSKSPAMR